MRCLLPLLILLALTSSAQGETYLELLRKRIRSSDERTREGAAEDLGRQSRPGVPIILEALADPNPNVRAAAARAFGRVRPKRAEDLKPLLRTLDDPNREAREAAGWALEQFGSKAAPAVPQLLERLASGDARTRRLMARALGAVGPEAAPAVPALIERLKAVRGLKVRAEEVVRALGNIGPAASSAIPVLRECQRTHPALAGTIERALKKIEIPSVEARPKDVPPSASLVILLMLGISGLGLIVRSSA